MKSIPPSVLSRPVEYPASVVLCEEASDPFVQCVGGEGSVRGPGAQKPDAGELAEWMLEDGLDVRMNLQIHKLIWEPETRGG
jgi:hypothetical protein